MAYERRHSGSKNGDVATWRLLSGISKRRFRPLVAEDGIVFGNGATFGGIDSCGFEDAYFPHQREACPPDFCLERKR